MNNEIEEYIFNLYDENKNCKINFFVREVEKQKAFFNKIADAFYKHNISNKEILEFLSNNLFISNILSGYMESGDYNIIDYASYKYLNSVIEATNAIDHLILVKKKIVIFDENGDLNTPSDLMFVNEIKSLVNIANEKNLPTIKNIEDINSQTLMQEVIRINDLKEELFGENLGDQNISIIVNSLKERGFNPSVTRGGIDIVVNINNVFTGIAILFSNSSLNEILNYYRTTKTEYKKYGWDVVFANVMTYSRGLNYLTDNICKQLNKKLPKKERSKKK